MTTNNFPVKVVVKLPPAERAKQIRYMREHPNYMREGYYNPVPSDAVVVRAIITMNFGFWFWETPDGTQYITQE